MLFAHLPDSHRDLAAYLLFDGQVGAGLAPLEQQLIIFQDHRSHGLCPRAAHLHLPDVEVASISQVILHILLSPF